MAGISGKTGMALAGLCLTAMAAAAQAPAPVQAPAFPAATRLEASQGRSIRNGILTATVYPPDERGFYRGTRFDHAGVVGSLKYGAQEFYGPWFDAISPGVRDFTHGPEGIVVGDTSGIMGPAEEYDPLGYGEAAAGGRFLQIGVGVLTRPDDRPFDRFRLYPVADAGHWTVTASANSVTMQQRISDGGYGFVYEKTVTLVPGQPQMTIRHRLRNTGSKPIASSMYNHNFLTLDPGNANIAVTLPFAPMLARQPQRLALDGNTVRWPEALVGRQTASATLLDAGSPTQPYDFTVQSTKTSAGYRVTGDAPVTRLLLWSIRSVMALEPYIAVSVAPGAEQNWSYTYTYMAPRPGG